GNPRESLRNPVLHVLDRMPLRVFAERGVHVAVEKERGVRGHGKQEAGLWSCLIPKTWPGLFHSIFLDTTQGLAVFPEMLWIDRPDDGGCCRRMAEDKLECRRDRIL